MKESSILLKRPLQWWLPLFSSSLRDSSVGVDIEKAFRLWDGEDEVWILPHLDKPVRWIVPLDGTPPYEYLAIRTPSEPRSWTGPIKMFGKFIIVLGVPGVKFNRIMIFHLNRQGDVWGPNAPRVFEGFSLKEFYSCYLRPETFGGVTFEDSAGVEEFPVPYHAPGGIGYALRPIHVAPGPVFTLEDLPGGFPSEPLDLAHRVSPHMESRRKLGETWRATPKSAQILFDGSRGANSAKRVMWSDPVGGLLPMGASADDLHFACECRKILEQVADSGAAAKFITDLAGPHLGSAQVTYGDLLGFPLPNGNQDSVMVELSCKYDDEPHTLSSLYEDPRWLE